MRRCLQAREVGRGLRHVQKADAVERALELLPALLHGPCEPDTHTEEARLDAGRAEALVVHLRGCGGGGAGHERVEVPERHGHESEPFSVLQVVHEQLARLPRPAVDRDQTPVSGKVHIK